MWWLIPAALSVFGAVKQYQAGKEMKDLAGRQEQQAAQNRELEIQQLAENVRRQDIADSRLRGSAMAKAAASGAEVTGSVSDYLGYIESEQSLEMQWMQRAGKTRADLNYSSGMSQAESTRVSGKSQQYAAFGQAAGAFSFLDKGGFLGGTGGAATTAGAGAGFMTPPSTPSTGFTGKGFRF